MKTTIFGIHIRNSLEYVKLSRSANLKTQLDDEVSYSIGAHLMIALAIEGFVNEIGEVAYGELNWKKFERNSTLKKWRKVSQYGGKEEFNTTQEPLLTVQHVVNIRNSIVHPKILDLGDDAIVRLKNSKILRTVNSDYVLKEGDFIWLGYGKLLEQFNYKTSFNVFKRSISAIKILREHLSVSGLNWIDSIENNMKNYA